jgi:hypothetical protein
MEHSDKDCDDTAVKQEIMDMPEDLSAKYKSVSVQTEKWGKYNFENLFDGFSQKQMKALMDILVVFVAKKDDEKIIDTDQLAEGYCKVSIQAICLWELIFPVRCEQFKEPKSF